MAGKGKLRFAGEQGAHAPVAHEMQSLALVIATSDRFACVPWGHGSAATEPGVQKYPSVHRLHAVAPSTGW